MGDYQETLFHESLCPHCEEGCLIFIMCPNCGHLAVKCINSGYVFNPSTLDIITFETNYTRCIECKKECYADEFVGPFPEDLLENGFYKTQFDQYQKLLPLFHLFCLIFY